MTIQISKTAKSFAPKIEKLRLPGLLPFLEIKKWPDKIISPKNDIPFSTFLQFQSEPTKKKKI